MYYNKIVFDNIPRVIFAHNHTTRHYDSSFYAKTNIIEITYIDRGDVIMKFDGGVTQLIPEQSVFVNMFDCNLSLSSKAAIHSHFTVGISMGFGVYSVTEKQMVECSRAAAVGELSELMFAIAPNGYFVNQNGSRIHNIIQKIINSHSSTESCRNMYCSGLVFELLSELTRESMRRAFLGSDHILSPGSFLYSEHALKYISSHISEKIIIADISKEIGISTGYLSNTFKAVTGQTLVEYITRVKINHVKEVIINKNLTMRDAAESVGIYDENYFSRVFKKYTGITVREFKSQARI